MEKEKLPCLPLNIYSLKIWIVFFNIDSRKIILTYKIVKKYLQTIGKYHNLSAIDRDRS